MNFVLKAYRAKEGVVTLRLDAADLVAALREAQEQGYRVISHSGSTQARTWLRGVRFPLGLFSQALLALLDAGMNLIEAIGILAEQERDTGNHHVSRTLDDLRRRLREGATFAEAMAAHPSHFPALYVATMRASERTGNLSDSLRRYLAYQSQVDAVRKRVTAAAIYPLLLLSVGTLVILFLVAYVVPRFSRVYEDLGESLPWMSRALMEWGKFFSAHWGAVSIGVAAALAVLAFLGSRAAVRAALARGLLRVPAVAEHARLYRLTRFFRTVAMLQRGGVPLITSLQMALGLLGAALGEAMVRAIREIQEGRAASDAFRSNALTSRIADGFLRVGERSGNLGEALERIAIFQEAQLEQRVDAFTRLFEPLLMVFLGLVVGVIVVLMYLPIFELAGSIQ